MTRSSYERFDISCERGQILRQNLYEIQRPAVATDTAAKQFSPRGLIVQGKTRKVSQACDQVTEVCDYVIL